MAAPPKTPSSLLTQLTLSSPSASSARPSTYRSLLKSWKKLSSSTGVAVPSTALINEGATAAKATITAASTDSSFVSGVHSLAGRKHHYRNFTVNEDHHGRFSFSVPSGGRVDVWYIADGHGQSIPATMSSSATTPCWSGSNAENFCIHLESTIRLVVPALFFDAMALFEVASDSEIDECNYDVQNELLIESVKAAFLKLHSRLNDHIAAIDPELVLENGSTLCLCLLFNSHLFCFNVGDSSIMAFSSSGIPLKIWRREGLDSERNICSYEDTLAHFPDLLREGQSYEAVRRDFDLIRKNVRVCRNGSGLTYYPVYSALSPYGLSMTNTLGNSHHQGQTFDRNTIYTFHLPTLKSEFPSESSILLTLVTDGVKDVLSANQIGSFFKSIEDGLWNLYGSEEASLERILERVVLGCDRFSLRAKDAILNLISEMAKLVQKREELHIEADLKKIKSQILDLVSETLCHVAIGRGTYDDTTCLVIEIPLSENNKTHFPPEVAPAAEQPDVLLVPLASSPSSPCSTSATLIDSDADPLRTAVTDVLDCPGTPTKRRIAGPRSTSPIKKSRN